MLGDQPFHHIEHAHHELAFVLAAVGEEGVVGGIDEAGVRPRFHDLAENGEPAKAGVEDEDAGRRCHRANGLQSLWRDANGLNEQRLASEASTHR